MTDSEFIITPDSKVGDILKAFPDLETVLLNMSPSFAKLKNPVLRKTVARVATLSQVAKVGNVPIGKLVNDLRKAAGQVEFGYGTIDDNNNSERPGWFKAEKVTVRLDADSMLETGEHPINRVMQILLDFENDEIVELKSSFNPAPLIDMAAKKGYESFQTITDGNMFLTYFTKLKGTENV